ncbi:cytochrome b-c1 complex subunit 2, mitochondrial-like [Daphnia pulex]|uniref:cytochrome b-c1 complex subunit 2, mitochondrial-like n=1 Tax=Daphnia pulex TaxID=6669 RepID=UPI001EDFE101|nr:cytochrome b-c1 complex subunit 2, mitochondrial-like [Daphnia pulex]XP_046642351.1 cytochrome b-c1 complex subunit 2, mitochondrial-like [Daphnia pulicaria]
MASKFLSTQTVKATRGFAAQAAAKPAATEFSPVPREPVKTTTLSNGIVVTSIETNAPLSRVGIAFKAGSRNEPSGKEGIIHLLRMTSSLSTKQSTQFSLTRVINQAGAALTCTSGREHVLYSVDASRKQIDGVLPKLADAATQQVFKPWELSDNLYKIKLDLAAVQPETQVIELLHKVAFRTGLANSLFCPSHLVGKHTTEVLQSFVAANLRADNAAVVGVGIPHDRLVAYAQSLALKAGQSCSGAPSKVHGGEVRVDTSSSLAYVAVAAPGASLADTKAMVAFALLQRALGAGIPVKYGSGAGSKLNQAVLGAGAVSSLNLNYSDAGLFGFVAAAPASDAGKVVSAATKVLRSASVNESQLSRAKAQLKADLLMAKENTGVLVEELALQALLNRADLLSTVDNVSIADVNAVASRLASAKLTVAAIGNLSNVPFVDEL